MDLVFGPERPGNDVPVKTAVLPDPLAANRKDGEGKWTERKQDRI